MLPNAGGARGVTPVRSDRLRNRADPSGHGVHSMRERTRILMRCLLLTLCSAASVAVWGGDEMGTVEAATVVQAPTAIDLIPANQDGVQRLFIPVSGVGDQATALNLLFDTGSGGLTLDATQIFPASMVGPNGFVFPPGQSTLQYHGITVTNAGTKVRFATRIQDGNLGWAQVSFGRAGHSVTTSSMPIFFYYAITDPAGNRIPFPPQKGIFGVSSDMTAVDGSLASPLRFVRFDHVNAGFMLSPVGAYPVCDVSQHSCAAKALLTVGLDPQQELAFSRFRMICDAQAVTGPRGAFLIDPGRDGCASVLPATVSVDGTSLNAKPLRMVVFDTGMPGHAISASLTGSALADGAVVNVSLPAKSPLQPVQYSWSVHASGPGSDTPRIVGPTLVGADFFQGHGYLLDFSQQLIGVQ